jgi:hypothetical protein
LERRLHSFGSPPAFGANLQAKVLRFEITVRTGDLDDIRRDLASIQL